MQNDDKHKKRFYEWDKLRDEFIQSSETLTAFGERHQIPGNRLRERAGRDSWLVLRAAHKVDLAIEQEAGNQTDTSGQSSGQPRADLLLTAAHERHLTGARALQTLGSRELAKLARRMQEADGPVLTPELALKFFEAGARLERQVVSDLSDNISLKLAKAAVLELLSMARHLIPEDRHAEFIEKVSKNASIIRIIG
jgi:hypothetical protein